MKKIQNTQETAQPVVSSSEISFFEDLLPWFLKKEDFTSFKEPVPPQSGVYSIDFKLTTME